MYLLLHFCYHTKSKLTLLHAIIRISNNNTQLQALNLGLPNPYKPGTKDYEHYQAGLAARKQNNGGGSSGSSTTNNGSGSGNHNNKNKSLSDNKTPHLWDEGIVMMEVVLQVLTIAKETKKVAAGR